MQTLWKRFAFAAGHFSVPRNRLFLARYATTNPIYCEIPNATLEDTERLFDILKTRVQAIQPETTVRLEKTSKDTHNVTVEVRKVGVSSIELTLKESEGKVIMSEDRRSIAKLHSSMVNAQTPQLQWLLNSLEQIGLSGFSGIAGGGWTGREP